MLAIDVRDSCIIVTMPHLPLGVANVVVALGEAHVEVGSVEPVDDCGVYRLTVKHEPQLPRAILESIGCRVLAAERCRSCR